MADADREKWDARHAESQALAAPAPAWLDTHDALLPRVGRALDIATGTGRVARWARSRGLEVTAVDISPVGLAKLSAAAPDIVTIERDLEADPRLPRGPFELVTCFHYRQPSLWPAMSAVLSRGGVLVAEVLGVANLDRHAHPSRRWLADPGELLASAAGLDVLYAEEAWFGGRYSARLIAKKSRR